MPTFADEVGFLLKDVFVGSVVTQFAKDQLWMNVLQKDGKFVVPGGGRQIVFPIHDERNTGGGAVAQDSALPPGGKQSGAQGTSTLTNQYFGVRISSKLIQAAKTDKQAFENAMSFEMKHVKDDMLNGLSRQCWGDGTGVLGTIDSISGAGPYVIQLTDSAIPAYRPLTRFIRPGQVITILDGSFGAVASQVGITVLAVDDVNGTFTVAANTNITTPSGYKVTAYLSHTAGVATGYELTGILSQFGSNTSTLYGINPADHPRWVPGFLSSVNQDPNEQNLSIMQQSLMALGTNPTLCVTSPGVMTKYKNGLLTYKRVVFDKGNDSIPGGVAGVKDIDKMSGPEIVDVGPMLVDNTTPQGVDPNTSLLWMGNPEHMGFQEAGDLHWMDEDGEILKFLVGNDSVASPSFPTYVGKLEWFLEMINQKRNSGGLLTSVNTQAVL